MPLRALSQWVFAAPNVVAQRSDNGGIAFRDGILWAGNLGALWKSSDTGATWVQSSPGFLKGIVREVNFFDRNIPGVVGEQVKKKLGKQFAGAGAK